MSPEERYKSETVSHSGLNAFTVSPRSYRRYKDRPESQESSFSLSLGSAVHCYILEPDEFYDRYIEAPENTPTPMYKKFVEHLAMSRPDGVFSTRSKKDWYEEAYHVAGFKNPLLPRVIERFETEPEFKEYYEFYLKLENDIQVLSAKEMTIVKLCGQSCATHKLASKLLFGYPFCTHYVEQEVRFNYPGFKFLMRGFLDRFIVNEKEKKCYVIDLKTSSKSVHSFSHSYGFYGYNRQLYLYSMAARYYLVELGLDPAEYEIVPYIVVVQTKDNFECAVYQPSGQSLLTGQMQVEEALKGLTWHFDNDVWDYPQSYYEGDGSLFVDL